MTQFAKLNSYIQQMNAHSNNSNQWSSIAQDNIRIFGCDNVENVKKFIQILTITQNIDLQIKLFSVLTACVEANESYREAVISSTDIYGKVQVILSRHLPQKTLVLLIFLTTLLYQKNDSSPQYKSLVVRAQNKIRTSGCLVHIANMFAEKMVIQNTWLALCECLVEICRDSKINQNYCSHLVPLAITKCLNGSVEVFAVLESLLKKNERNIKLFMDSDGISLFTEENLLKINCMHLLNTVIKNPSAANVIVEKSNIVNYLRCILDSHGSDSKAGQWAITILHQAKPYLKESEEQQDVTQRIIRFQFKKANENAIENKSNLRTEAVDADNTATIFKNLYNEINQWGLNTDLPQNEFEQLDKIFNSIINDDYQIQGKSERKHKERQILANDRSARITGRSEDSDITFFNISRSIPTPLQKLKKYKRNKTHTTHKKHIQTPNERHIFSHKTIHNKNKDKTANKNMINSADFKPIYSSTPNDTSVNSFSPSISRCTSRKSTSLVRKKSIQKPEVKRNSISRIINVINESCANMFNTVKHIFVSKNQNYESNETNQMQRPECSYSFTNYMRNRDEYLKTGNKIEKFSHRNDTCTTCNDTKYLKEKLENDEYLKQTLKKLKIGIYLYGCDFKKICRTFWSREPYITPAILYNLYRKLILK